MEGLFCLSPPPLTIPPSLEYKTELCCPPFDTHHFETRDGGVFLPTTTLRRSDARQRGFAATTTTTTEGMQCGQVRTRCAVFFLFRFLSNLCYRKFFFCSYIVLTKLPSLDVTSYISLHHHTTARQRQQHQVTIPATTMVTVTLLSRGKWTRHFMGGFSHFELQNPPISAGF